jgi:hypothetical protein
VKLLTSAPLTRIMARMAIAFGTWTTVFTVAGMILPTHTMAVSTTGGAPLVLDWLGTVTPSEIRVTGKEVLFRLSAPLKPSAAAQPPKDLPQWVDGVVTGYDTLLVIAKYDRDFDISEDSGNITVNLLPEAEPADTSPADTSLIDPTTPTLRSIRAPRRIERLQARYLAETGDSGEAVVMLDRLVQEDPKDFESLVQLAQVSNQRGKWRTAVKNFEQALSVKPGLIAAEREKIRIEEEYGPQMRLDFDYQKVEKGDRQFITRFSGRAPVNDRLEIGALLESRWLKDKNVQRPSGLLTNKIDENRQRGEIYATWEHDTPSATRLALLAGPSSIGFQADHMIRHGGEAQSRFTFAYARPYWDLVEGIVDGGTVDEIEARHERPLGPRFFLVTTAALSNYSLKNENKLAQTVGGGLEIYYRFKDFGPVRTIGYGLDAEYLLNRTSRLLPDLSDSFSPMPVPTQEFHSINVAIEDHVGERFKYAIYTGYSYDRFAGDGPFVNASLATNPLKSLEVGARITHAQTSGRGTEGSFLMGGAYALWRF